MKEENEEQNQGKPDITMIEEATSDYLKNFKELTKRNSSDIVVRINADKVSNREASGPKRTFANTLTIGIVSYFVSLMVFWIL